MHIYLLSRWAHKQIYGPILNFVSRAAESHRQHLPLQQPLCITNSFKLFVIVVISLAVQGMTMGMTMGMSMRRGSRWRRRPSRMRGMMLKNAASLRLSSRCPAVLCCPVLCCAVVSLLPLAVLWLCCIALCDNSCHKPFAPLVDILRVSLHGENWQIKMQRHTRTKQRSCCDAQLKPPTRYLPLTPLYGRAAISSLFAALCRPF